MEEEDIGHQGTLWLQGSAGDVSSAENCHSFNLHSHWRHSTISRICRVYSLCDSSRAVYHVINTHDFYQAVKSPISRLPISVYIPSVLQHISLYTNSSDISEMCPSRHFSFKLVLVFATALCWLKKRKTTVCEGSQLSRLSSSLKLGLGNWTVGPSDLTWYPRVTKYQHDCSSIC